MASSSQDFSNQAERLLKTALFFKISEDFKQLIMKQSNAFSENQDQELEQLLGKFTKTEKQKVINILGKIGSPESEEKEQIQKNEDVVIDLGEMQDSSFEKY